VKSIFDGYSGIKILSPFDEEPEKMKIICCS